MRPIVTYEGVDEALKNLRYTNKNALKTKLINIIREQYSLHDGSVDSVNEIDTDFLVKTLWETGDDPALIRSRRKNFNSIKSTVNTDLKKLYSDGLNKEGIIINQKNIFDMSDEAKSEMLEAFSYGSKGNSQIPLDKITDVLSVINDFISNKESGIEANEKFEQLKELIKDISGKVGISIVSEDSNASNVIYSKSPDAAPLQKESLEEVVIVQEEQVVKEADEIAEEAHVDETDDKYEELELEDVPEEELDDSNEDEVDVIEEPIDETDEFEDIGEDELAERPDDGMEEELLEGETEDVPTDEVEDIPEEEIEEITEDAPEEKLFDDIEEVSAEEIEDIPEEEIIEEPVEESEDDGLEEIEVEDVPEEELDEANEDDVEIVEEPFEEETNEADEFEEIPEEELEEVPEDEIEEELIDDDAEDVPTEEIEEIPEEEIVEEPVEEIEDDELEEIEVEDVPEEELDEANEDDVEIVEEPFEEETNEADEFEEIPEEELEEVPEDEIEEELIDDGAEDVPADEIEEIPEEEIVEEPVEEIEDGELEDIEVEDVPEEELEEVHEDDVDIIDEPLEEDLDEVEDIEEIPEEELEELSEDALEEELLDDDIEEIPADEADIEEVSEELEEEASEDDLEIVEDPLDEPLDEVDAFEDVPEDELEEIPEEAVEEPADEPDIEFDDIDEIPEDELEEVPEEEIDDLLDDGNNYTLEEILNDYDTTGYLSKEAQEKALILADRFDKMLSDTERYYNRYLLVPGGRFLSVNAPSKTDSKSQKYIDLPDFYFGKFPVTNNLFELFIEKTGYVTTAERIGYGTVYRGRYRYNVDEKSGRKILEWNSSLNSEKVDGACWYQPHGPGSTVHGKRNFPVVQVTLEDAMAFAAWTGKRLPTEQEWEAAARTSSGLDFPWGKKPDKEKCNIEASAIGDTTPVEKYQKAANKYEIYDLLGNVLEWTASSETHDGNVTFIAKGGSWVSGDNITLTSKFLLDPKSPSNIVGFRCITYK